MILQSVERGFAGESMFWKHNEVGSSKISPYLYSAIVAGEDQRFFSHHGFDMVEIDHAQHDHALHPQRQMRGASTLTQQLAKNLFLPPVHSFVRKGIEAYYAVLMEFFWPKMRILNLYANSVEFAPGVYGAEAGARFHFHKSAETLSPVEASLLAAVLPNPKRYSASHPSAYILRRAARIQRQMRGIHTNEDEDGTPD